MKIVPRKATTKFVSLFAGIGGFDLGFGKIGWKPVLQVEIDKYCHEILARYWPGVPKIGDIRDVKDEAKGANVICGGDPCPSRSLARGNRPTKVPDLAGYFLALAGRSGAQWVVRENVPAPNIVEFALALEALGYGVVTFGLDARDFTGQSRRRQFCIGCPSHLTTHFARVVSDAADAFGFVSSRSEEETPIAACITAHPCRMAAEDSYCYEPGHGLRVLSPEECEALQGFPGCWTAGFSRSRRRIMIGRAVPPPMIEWIGRRIMEVIV